MKPVARVGLLEWGAKRFVDLKPGTDMKAIVPGVLESMNDKDGKVKL